MQNVDFIPIKPPKKRRLFIKRSFDIISSGLVILLLLPFFILFTPVVALAMKGNPFFVQKRPGKNGKPFKLIKYRTMTNAKDENGVLLSDSLRLTKFGRIMRKLSIDELPELFNILFGTMSVVGPRPLALKYVNYYNDFEKQRQLVRPGLTGYAQINGRSALDWERRFYLDVYYVEHLSFIFDMKIIFGTIKKVLASSDTTERDEIPLLNFDLYRKNQIAENLNGIREIGSEFWLVSNGEKNDSHQAFLDGKLCFCGRTAEKIIAEDLTRKGLKRIFIPSYGCDSMVLPYKEIGLEIVFYDVMLQDGAILIEMDFCDAKNTDAILLCDYFSYKAEEYLSLYNKAKEMGCTVIHDITHSLFDNNAHLAPSDYAYASIRKWLPVLDGGIYWGKKQEDELLPVSNDFIINRRSAMGEKYRYIYRDNAVKKADFLDLYKKAEDILSKEFSDRAISQQSKNIIEKTAFLEMKRIRNENAKLIQEGLFDKKYLKVGTVSDSPLVVPIFFDTKLERDACREYLKENGIYLPIHWEHPINCDSSNAKNIADRELSLVIDQRYKKIDIQKEIDGIINFMEKKC